MISPHGVAGFAGLAIAMGLCAVSCSTAGTESTMVGDGVTTTSPASTIQTTGETAEDSASTSTNLVLDAPVPDGGAVVLPDGPYVDGQEVTLLADGSERIDLYNSFPRLCARIDGGSEICDPALMQPRPVDNPPVGTQGIAIEIPRTYLGPGGERDCAEPEVECRLVWRTETGRLLATDAMSFTGAVEPAVVSFGATIGDRPGAVTVRARGLDAELSVGDVFSPAQLRTIEDAVQSMAEFDSSELRLTWGVGGLCGFGPGDPPLGSGDLESLPSWWARPTIDPAVDSALVQSFYGGSCDELATVQPKELSDGGSVDLVFSRDIYGFGGWIDCASTACWLELFVSWSYPMPDGSTLGSHTTVDRVLIDVPETWPSQRPSISVVEPGPYSPGQQVTVEIRDHPVAGEDLGIGWCPGGDGQCSYRFSTFADGVHRVSWQLPPGASECGSNRCFFEIESPSEGLAPPAIIVVPVLGE